MNWLPPPPDFTMVALCSWVEGNANAVNARKGDIKSDTTSYPLGCPLSKSLQAACGRKTLVMAQMNCSLCLILIAKTASPVPIRENFISWDEAIEQANGGY